MDVNERDYESVNVSPEGDDDAASYPPDEDVVIELPPDDEVVVVDPPAVGPLYDEVVAAYEYDTDGYFNTATQVQVASETREPVGLPERTTLTPPEIKEGYFSRWNGSAWVAEKAPASAEECVGIRVPLDSKTLHDLTLRELFERFTDGSDTHRLVITEDRVCYVEPITEDEKAAERLAEAKRIRAEKVASIKVTVDGMVFDGDETAQSRMARAVTAADTSGLDSTVWVLADNTVATVTKAQLQQALALSMVEMGKVWTDPYEDDSPAPTVLDDY